MEQNHARGLHRSTLPPLFRAEIKSLLTTIIGPNSTALVISAAEPFSSVSYSFALFNIVFVNIVTTILVDGK